MNAVSRAYWRSVGIAGAALAMSACAALADAAEVAPRFAVYLADLDEGSSAPRLPESYRHPRDRTHVLTQEHLLATAVKRGEPILTECDIVEYCWATQRVVLTPSGVARWSALGGVRVPLTGIPLLVEVDGQPRYGALLWNPVSSLGSRLPQIWCMTIRDRLIIGGLFMSAEGDTTYTESYDPAVREVMREMGKLSLDCARR